MLVVAGKLRDIKNRFKLFDEKDFWEADCIEWKAQPPPLWAYTYPKTMEYEDIVIALIIPGGLKEEQMREFEKKAKELLKTAKSLINF